MSRLANEYREVYRYVAGHRVLGMVWSMTWAAAGLWGIAPGGSVSRSLVEFRARCAV